MKHKTILNNTAFTRPCPEAVDYVAIVTILGIQSLEYKWLETGMGYPFIGNIMALPQPGTTYVIAILCEVDSQHPERVLPEVFYVSEKTIFEVLG